MSRWWRQSSLFSLIPLTLLFFFVGLYVRENQWEREPPSFLSSHSAEQHNSRYFRTHFEKPTLPLPQSLFFWILSIFVSRAEKDICPGGARKDGGGGKTRGKRQPKYIRSNFNKQRAFDVGFRQDNPASFRYFLNPIAHINLELVHESKSDGGIDTHFPFFCSVLFKHRAASSISSNIYTHFKSREKGGHWALLPSRPLSLDIPTSLFKLLVREKTSKRESCGRLKNRSSTTFLCWSVGRKM